MPDIYGGLWFESLVAKDDHWRLQLELFRKGIIQGLQIRVAHRIFTPGVTVSSLPEIFGALPEDLKLFFHFGAENVGVDLGENLDEALIFSRFAQGVSWRSWNQETIAWGLKIARALRARIPEEFPLGVAHPGYGSSFYDSDSWKLIIQALKGFSSEIALENVPPAVDQRFYEKRTKGMDSWSRQSYWGFGGIPGDMFQMLEKLGPGWRCLIDFTHLFEMRNQAEEGISEVPSELSQIEEAVRRYLKLPHWPICHFSGLSPLLIDSHDYLAALPIPVIREAMAGMKAICLEIPFRPKTAQKEIEHFRKAYKFD